MVLSTLIDSNMVSLLSNHKTCGRLHCEDLLSSTVLLAGALVLIKASLFFSLKTNWMLILSVCAAIGYTKYSHQGFPPVHSHDSILSVYNQWSFLEHVCQMSEKLAIKGECCLMKDRIGTRQLIYIMIWGLYRANLLSWG